MPQQTTLPPESARTMAYIEREAAGTIAQTEQVLGITLPAHARTRLIDHCMQWETAEAARQLRALNLSCPN